MSIKEYIKDNTNQESWIDYIIETLLGTTNDLDSYLLEYKNEGFDVDYLLTSIDHNIWKCEGCGWWVDVGETNDEGYCEDCQDD